MPTFNLQWTSTLTERYESDMNDRAREVVGLAAIDLYGGTDGYTADNGISILVADLVLAKSLAKKVADTVGHDVRVLNSTGDELAKVVAR